MGGSSSFIWSKGRARKVGRSDYTEQRYSTPYHHGHDILPGGQNLNDTEIWWSSIKRSEEFKEHFPSYASGAAFLLSYEGDEFDSPLDSNRYIDVLNKPESDPELCEQLSRANVIVEFIGIEKGRRSLIQIKNGRGRVDMTRGPGTYQRFVCRRKDQKANVCGVLPISSSSLAAGLVALRSNTSIYEITNNTVIADDDEFTTTTKLADPISAEQVEEALDLGIIVLIAGSAAIEKEGMVQLAREIVVFNWRAYAATAVTTIAFCMLLLIIEFLARIRLGQLRLGIDAPLDPLHMAQVCGAGMEIGDSLTRMRTPSREIGHGVHIVRPRGGSATTDAYWRVGPPDKGDDNFDVG